MRNTNVIQTSYERNTDVIQPGIYKDLSNEAYHADPAIGSSGVKEFIKCAAMYYAKYKDPNRPPFEPSASMEFGSHAHLVLLEPNEFDKTYKVLENDSITAKNIKPWKDFAKESKEAGYKPLLKKEFDAVIQMSAMVRHNELAHKMLTGGIAECSFFAKDEDTGLILKGRPDYITSIPDFGKVIVDYKTTSAGLGDEEQSKQAFNLKYYIQAAHHKYVVEKATGVNIGAVCYVTQQSSYPYLVRTFVMGQEYIDIGLDEMRDALPKIKECEDAKEWPSYPQELVYYQAPSWFNYKYKCEGV